MEDIRKPLREKARALGVSISLDQAEQFQIYLEMLLDWNTRINLTAITDPEEVVEKHFLDSLSILAHSTLRQGAKVCDVGTGAGFPGVPLVLLRPDIRLCLLDGQQKRLRFLEALCDALHIRAEFLHKRAEEAGRLPEFRERFDTVTARAVAPLPILAEYCLPLVKMKGEFLAMKGPGAAEELKAAQSALMTLGGTRAQAIPFTLFSAGERTILRVQKRAYTPKEFPRHGGTITKHPL